MKPDYYVIDFYTGNTIGSYSNLVDANKEAENLTSSTGKKHVVAKSFCIYKPITK